MKRRLKPTLQRGLKAAQLGRGLMLVDITQRFNGLKMLAHPGPRQFQIPRGGTDDLLADQMPPPDFGNNFHV
ncbi:hypothetical protein LNV08_09240 [Paucibacter sp. TC2R-5]|uniref:hypothetical protein n=1 Tax=Paucibacter sp. TC2R-5 TaxID=2893555 RepID=UPI0021E511F9|nr:hypothetical protein [Paucibacter sp. TC2R-5]MCV2359160.1 hypothetical protein [Paucibacter sp. TC2R-5]